jgi:hypothetical protein
MDNRKVWTRQQTQLRQLLSARAHFKEAIQLFLQQHATVHSAEISSGQVWSLQDEALAGLTDEQIKTCLRPKTNSIAWLLWHTARIEDITMNFLVFERPQILLSADWATCLGLSIRDVGAGMGDAEVVNFSAQVSIQALKDYRAAVGRSTQSGVTDLQPSQLKEVVSESTVQRLVNEGAISQNALWLAEYYSGRPKGFFLTRITSHNFIHLNEASRVRARLIQ